ncbi:NAD(P)H-binding protein [Dyadobacter sp. CY261]|uniref:NAD(P)H-binding protein n=1 Tax=Dyadobacter sp. CY261 TaxID=2907203 RepID=UPI001F32D9D5|nr:NAD(P)H-binding protein [Dyadobacter sp. CY261]MCF0068836.1 NAD(P)H-binding protein [Dyadobacter sp. CY261]
MKALIIGATGATGRDLVNLLLQDPEYTRVISFVRRPAGIVHSKLTEHVIDFSNLNGVAAYIQGDIWFSCLGTTLKAAGSKEEQWRIDYEIPLTFAHIARRNGVSTVVLLSSYGASSESSVVYLKIKGQLEEQIAGLTFDRYIIFRPGHLLRINTDRPVERLTTGLLALLNGLRMFKKFRPLPTHMLAKKMARAPKFLAKGVHVIELEEIFGF